ncbi:MAG: YfdX family protein [Bdellovibrionia bacterium]
MKKLFKKQVFALSAFFLAGSLASVTAFSANTKPVESDDSGKTVENNTQDQMAEKRQKISQEAMAAIRETQNALKSLDDGKTKEALSALERATGKLELILAREPTLSLAAAGVWVTTQRTLADVNQVAELRSQALRLLNVGRLQEARHLLQNLASETIINVSNIPLVTYPSAIKEAVRFVDQSKMDDAKRVLQTALNTLVITQTVIPVPVVQAEQKLKKAEALAETKDRPADSNAQMTSLLKEARTDLELAQALGYGTKDDFKNLYEQLKDIENKTEKGKSGNNIFAKIKTSISDLLKKAARPFEKDNMS